jgi:PAS domain S-box-containing protein
MGIAASTIHPARDAPPAADAADTQERLRAAEREFRALFEEAPLPYHELDRHGRVVRANRAVCKALGMRPDEILGKPIWNLVVATEREVSRQAFEGLIREHKTPRPFERTFQTRDGTPAVFQVHLSLIEGSTGEVTGVRGALLDLTASRRAQREIEFQANLLNQVPEAIVASDVDFTIRYWSPGAARMFGFTSEQVIGRKYHDVLQADLSGIERQMIVSDLLASGSWRGEITYRTGIGGRVTADLSVTVVRDNYTDEPAIVLVARDVMERKRTEEALRVAESHLQLAQSQLSLGTWEFDIDTRVAHWSGEAHRLYGIPEAFEPNLDLWSSYLHPEDRPRVLQGLAKAIESGISVDHQFRIVRPDGLVRWVHSRVRAVCGEDGRAHQLIGVDLDFTGQRHAEERLRLLSAAIEQSPVSIMITDLNGAIQYSNPKASELTGYSPEELQGKNRRIFKSGETPRQTYEKLWETIQTGEWHGFLHNKRKNGELFWEDSKILPIRDSSNKPTHFLAVGTDISQRIATEEALKNETHLFNLLMENSPEHVYFKDLQGRFTRVNRSQAKLFGMSDPAQLIGKSDFDFFTTEHAKRASEDERALLLGSLPILSKEEKETWPDGHETWVLTTKMPLRDPSGEIVGTFGASRDITERKVAEEALRQSEERYRTLIEAAAEGVWITDSADVTTFVNRRMAEMLGADSKDLPGRIIHDFLRPEDPAQLQKIRHDFATTRKAIFETRIERIDGKLLWVSVSAVAIPDSAGGLECIFGLFTDITTRKKAAEDLRISQERFRIAAEISGGIIYEADLQSGGVQFFSNPDPAAGEIPNPEEFLDRMHRDNRDGVKRAMRERWSSGERFSEAYRVVLPSGKIRYWTDTWRALLDSTGAPQKRIGVARDVTEERATDRANAELAAVFESADIAIFSTDLNGDVLNWNAGAERLYGFSAGEMTGHKVLALIPPDRLKEREFIVDRVRRGEGTSHLETVRINKTGGRVDILLTIWPIRSRAGEVTGAANISWDITQLRLMQRQLVQAQKLESIGQLAAGIAHEINTPIQYIGDNGKFLEEAFQDLFRVIDARRRALDGLLQDPTVAGSLAELDRAIADVDVDYLHDEIPRAIAQLLEGVAHVARIVRAMKEFSHPGQVEMTPVDLNRTIESTAIVSRNEWKYVAELTTDLDPALPPVPCLASEFNQVMLNLIVNAAHAIADAVKGNGSKGSIRITTRVDGPWVEIRVADTGTGIPESIQSRVFDPFFTTKEVGKGTGQGLAIAHSVVVQKHRGTIRFESKPGIGTTFIVRLPLERAT